MEIIVFCIWATIMIGAWVLGKIFDFKILKLNKETDQIKRDIDELERKADLAKKGYNVQIFTEHCDEIKFIATISHIQILKQKDYQNN